jgi:hypothetical protein
MKTLINPHKKRSRFKLHQLREAKLLLVKLLRKLNKRSE